MLEGVGHAAEDGAARARARRARRRAPKARHSSGAIRCSAAAATARVDVGPAGEGTPEGGRIGITAAGLPEQHGRCLASRAARRRRGPSLRRCGALVAVGAVTLGERRFRPLHAVTRAEPVLSRALQEFARPWRQEIRGPWRYQEHCSNRSGPQTARRFGHRTERARSLQGGTGRWTTCTAKSRRGRMAQGDGATLQRGRRDGRTGRPRLSRRQAMGRMSAVATAGAAAWVVPEILTAKPAAGATLSGTVGAGVVGRRASRPAPPPAATGGVRRRQRHRRHRRARRRDHGSRHDCDGADLARLHRSQHPARRRGRRGAGGRRLGHAALGQPHPEAGRGRPVRRAPGGGVRAAATEPCRCTSSPEPCAALSYRFAVRCDDEQLGRPGRCGAGRAAGPRDDGGDRRPLVLADAPRRDAPARLDVGPRRRAAGARPVAPATRWAGSCGTSTGPPPRRAASTCSSTPGRSRPAAPVCCCPGASGSGKSTLTAGLARAGLGYLTDELAALDLASGQLLPYPKPITVKPGSFAVAARDGPGPGPESRSRRRAPARWAGEEWQVAVGGDTGRRVGTARARRVWSWCRATRPACRPA